MGKCRVVVVIAGASGFLGGALRRSLVADGHQVVSLSRGVTPADPNTVRWTPDGTASGDWAKSIDGATAVVNLAGEGIADRRWSEGRKHAIVDSRVRATRSLVAAIAQATSPPTVFLSASGVGYYGPHGDDIVTEATRPGTDFLARLCREWEREAEHAASITRVALCRTSMALHPEGGALGKMLLPFRMGVGGPIGSGRQWTPWIHRDDWVALARWILTMPAAHGAFNAAAPEPVPNADFTRALGRALRRPAIVPMPAVALRVMFGEMAEMLLTGQRAIPARAVEMGFTFRFRKLEEALDDLFPAG
jgi:uncharacterized protein (TIGR01777 family)